MAIVLVYSHRSTHLSLWKLKRTGHISLGRRWSWNTRPQLLPPGSEESLECCCTLYANPGCTTQHAPGESCHHEIIGKKQCRLENTAKYRKAPQKSTALHSPLSAAAIFLLHNYLCVLSVWAMQAAFQRCITPQETIPLLPSVNWGSYSYSIALTWEEAKEFLYCCCWSTPFWGKILKTWDQSILEARLARQLCSSGDQKHP